MIDGVGLRRLEREVARRSGARRRAVLSMLVGGALAALWVAGAGSLASASARWLTATVVVFSVAMLRVPFALFWRTDAGLLTRLPIRGRPLWDATMAQTWELAGQALAAASLAAAPLALFPSGLAALGRGAALAATLAVATGWLVPAVALGAGALVVSGKAAALLDGLGGEVQAPPTAWLGVLPGLAAASCVLLAIDLAGWLPGGSPEVGAPVPLLGGAAAISAVAMLAARLAAERVLPAILRDVSALDRQQLAVLEVTPAPASLRAVAKLAGARARLLVDKHGRVMSRRYPLAAVLGAVVFAVLAISAAASPAATSVQAAALAIAAGYALVLRRRLGAEPVELPRLLDTLPISVEDARAATRVYLAWWWTWAALVPAALAVARSSQPLQLGGALAVASAALALAARR